VAEGEPDIFRHGHRVKQRRLLEQHAELAAHGQEIAFAQRHDIPPFDQHLAGIRLEQADEMLEQQAG
jgi:hypothetical protein